MCGIAGYVGVDPLPRERIDACLARMARRGPDHAGFVHHRLDRGGHAYLLNTRLSIIDIDTRSNQPFSVGRKWITYNGELYNYVELRRLLQADGYRPRTSSDTEVVLALIDRFGWDALDRCEGMWAFAIFDAADQSLMLVRDRFGEKPLYVRRTPQGVYFGSEPKCLSALADSALRPNRTQVRRLLVNGYKSIYKTGETFFDDVAEIAPGVRLRIDADRHETEERYWRPRHLPNDAMSREDAIAGVRERLTRSVEIRLRADVPLAFCMSGGIDSNAIVAIAKKTCGYDVHGFTVLSSDARYDERSAARCSAANLGVRHTEVTVDTHDFLVYLRELVAYHDSPVSTISYFAHARLIEAIAASGYRIAVSGTGADELLTGYYDHHLAYLAAMRHDVERHAAARNGWERRVRPFVRNPLLCDPDLFVKQPAFREHIYFDAARFSAMLREPFAEPFVEAVYTTDLLRNRMLNELTAEAVPVILHEDDLNSMYYSVENRSPYLDRSLVEFCSTIPTAHLIRDGFAKALLRDAVRDVVPSAIVDNPRKVGFNLTVTEVLDGRDPSVRAAVLADGPVWGIVRREAVAALLDRRCLTNSESKFLFSVVSAKMFLDQF
jgi:asparagine synthase (glutamine-hydrolysing)